MQSWAQAYASHLNEKCNDDWSFKKSKIKKVFHQRSWPLGNVEGLMIDINLRRRGRPLIGMHIEKWICVAPSLFLTFFSFVHYLRFLFIFILGCILSFILSFYYLFLSPSLFHFVGSKWMQPMRLSLASEKKFYTNIHHYMTYIFLPSSLMMQLVEIIPVSVE